EHAVEPPRELPASIRLWLNQTNQLGRPAQQGLAAVVLGGLSLAAALALPSPSPLVAVGIPAALLVGILPSALRMQRVLAAGYGIDDIRAGLRAYWRQRREEELFALSSPAHTLERRTVKWICGVSTVAATATSILTASAFTTSLPAQI